MGKSNNSDSLNALVNHLSHLCRFHKGDGDHLKLSKYQVHPADVVDGSSLPCSCSCPSSPVPTGVPIDFPVQWTGLVHWLVSSAMLTQTRGTEDVIRCHMVLRFRGSESREQGSAVPRGNEKKKQFEEVKANGTDRWIKINTQSMHVRMDRWTDESPPLQKMRLSWPTLCAKHEKCIPDHRCNPWQLPWSETHWQIEERVQVIQEIHLVARSNQTSQAIKPKPPLNGWLVPENPVLYLSPGKALIPWRISFWHFPNPLWMDVPFSEQSTLNLGSVLGILQWS